MSSISTTSSSASVAPSNSGSTTFSPLFSSTFSDPQPSPTTSSDGGNPGNAGGAFTPPSSSSASLYLYTFLATLVLLLGVSSAIVVRSLILRRRHRAMVEEAIRNGTWLPPSPTRGRSGRNNVDIGKKPTVWEVHIGEKDDNADAGKEVQAPTWKQVQAQDVGWNYITPFFAAYLNRPKPKPEPAPSSTGASDGNNTEENETFTSSFFSRFARIARREPRSSHISPAIPPANLTSLPPTTVEEPSLESKLESSRLRVAVLIAMPSPSGVVRQVPAGEEAELPHVEVGITTVDVTSHSNDLNLSGDKTGNETPRTSDVVE